MIALDRVASWIIVADVAAGAVFFGLAYARTRRPKPEKMPDRWLEDFHRRVR